MSDMLDRLARALFVAADDAHNMWPSPAHPECMKMARAALVAMREPTAAMVKAGEAVNEFEYGDSEHGFGGGSIDPTNAWYAMIDEVLK